MTKSHRRVLEHKEPRCHPLPDCPLQAGCARFTTPLPQGFGAVVANFRSNVLEGTGGSHFCTYHLSTMLTDAEKAEIDAAAAKKAIKPSIGGW